MSHPQITVTVVIIKKSIKAKKDNRKSLLISALSLDQPLRMVQPKAKPELNVFVFNRFSLSLFSIRNAAMVHSWQL